MKYCIFLKMTNIRNFGRRTTLMFDCLVIDFIVQKKRDKYCNDRLPPSCEGKYRARYGLQVDLKKWGCFCEENLSDDMNFNNNNGNYNHHFDLMEIN